MSHFPVTAPPKAPNSPAIQGGRPLPAYLRDWFEDRFHTDFSDVRLHHGYDAARTARLLRASALTMGDHLMFARDAYQPHSMAGRRLIAHELAHVAQQRRDGRAVIARKPADWLNGGSRLLEDIPNMSDQNLQIELDELEDWLNQQIRGSVEDDHIRVVAHSIKLELARRQQLELQAGKRRAKKKGLTEPDKRIGAAPLPRILTERGSRVLTDPVEIRDEYNLISERLRRSDISQEERRLLEVARLNLTPKTEALRQQEASQRKNQQIAKALEIDPKAADALAGLARTIMEINADPQNPEQFYIYIYSKGNRVPISRGQRDYVRTTLASELRHAYMLTKGNTEMTWERYEGQVKLDSKHWVISYFASLLGGVDDPGMQIVMARLMAQNSLIQLDALLKTGDMVGAATILPRVNANCKLVRALADAYYFGMIKGAERVLTVLEITAAVSAAVAVSIAAVVAAPFVAGAVAGAGITGAGGTVLTIAGTGTVVGTGNALYKGGTAALVTAVGGGSADDAWRAFKDAGWAGAKEGFFAGAGGAAARALGPALRSAGVGNKVLERVATEMVVNGGSTTLDAMASGASVQDAVQAGLFSAATSLPGGALGAANNKIVSQIAAPLASSAAAFATSLNRGETPEQAARAATTALAVSLSVNAATSGRTAELAGYQAKGQAVGKQVKSAAISTTAALMIGTAKPLQTSLDATGPAANPSALVQPASPPKVQAGASLPARPAEPKPKAPPATAEPVAPRSLPVVHATGSKPVIPAVVAPPSKAPAALKPASEGNAPDAEREPPAKAAAPAKTPAEEPPAAPPRSNKPGGPADPLTKQIEQLPVQEIGNMIEFAQVEAERRYFAMRYRNNPKAAAKVATVLETARNTGAATADLPLPDRVDLHRRIAEDQSGMTRRSTTITTSVSVGVGTEKSPVRDVNVVTAYGDNPQKRWQIRPALVKKGGSYPTMQKDLNRRNIRGQAMGLATYLRSTRNAPDRLGAGAASAEVRVVEAARLRGGMASLTLEQGMTELGAQDFDAMPLMRMPEGQPVRPLVGKKQGPAPAGDSFPERTRGTGDLNAMAGEKTGALAQYDAGVRNKAGISKTAEAQNRERRFAAEADLFKTLNRVDESVLLGGSKAGAALEPVRSSFRAYMKAWIDARAAPPPGSSRVDPQAVLSAREDFVIALTEYMQKKHP
ncbi:hypothetical protein AFK24_15620 [Pseudomonas syringae]|uniref:eCIS core domain-containing protein n=1 Tax=Pseudomonas syringae TaxID=317 RepID=A0A1C7Z2M4_PSESX|nr:DUF4157 domain-containing protein [Pseudomonas syringae]OCR24181.1 hypothetical protein AFK24_15620 [Pseudomonas syringae]